MLLVSSTTDYLVRVYASFGCLYPKVNIPAEYILWTRLFNSIILYWKITKTTKKCANAQTHNYRSIWVIVVIKLSSTNQGSLLKARFQLFFVCNLLVWFTSLQILLVFFLIINFDMDKIHFGSFVLGPFIILKSYLEIEQSYDHNE